MKSIVSFFLTSFIFVYFHISFILEGKVVNRTGPLMASSPGVVEYGLKASKRVSSSRRTKERIQRSNCEGRSSWRRPERNRLQPDDLGQLNLD